MGVIHNELESSAEWRRCLGSLSRVLGVFSPIIVEGLPQNRLGDYLGFYSEHPLNPISSQFFVSFQFCSPHGSPIAR